MYRVLIKPIIHYTPSTWRYGKDSSSSIWRRPAPLEKVFAPLAGKFSHWNLPKLRSAKRIEYDVRANWKLIFENYSECYHCPGVHPTLSKLTPYDSAENDLCEGPFLGGFMPITKGKSLTMTGNACALPVGDIKAEDHARVFYYSIFPNMLLSMHPDYVMVHQLWPQSPERTLILCDWFFSSGRGQGTGDPGYKYNPEDAIEFWDMTNKQDWHVCELSQQRQGTATLRSLSVSPLSWLARPIVFSLPPHAIKAIFHSWC